VSQPFPTPWRAAVIELLTAGAGNAPSRRALERAAGVCYPSVCPGNTDDEERRDLAAGIVAEMRRASGAGGMPSEATALWMGLLSHVAAGPPSPRLPCM
jgi:hypothetical protein